MQTIKASQITIKNISFLTRAQLEHVFLERERTRDLAIGGAFVIGGLCGAAMLTVCLLWLP